MSHLSEETKIMSIIQTVEEEQAFYFGYAIFRVLVKSSC